jgi:hypothetical protein
MPQDLFVPVEKTVIETEQVGVTVKEISMSFADSQTAGVLSIVLAPKDETGEWREDVTPVVVRIVDDLKASAPLERYAATAYQLFLLQNETHPLVAMLRASMLARTGVDIMTLTKADASKVMLPFYLPGGESGGEDQNT